MSSLSEFLKQLETQKKKDKAQTISIPSSKSIELAVAETFSAPDLTNSLRLMKASSTAKFSSNISQLATSDEVINELSDTIGAPKENESENEFVERAKSALKDILMKKLSK